MARCAESAWTGQDTLQSLSDKGVFTRIVVGIAAKGSAPKTNMIGATYLEGTPHGVQPAREKRGTVTRSVEKRWHEYRLHAVTGARGRPVLFFMQAGQVSDDTGTAALSGSLPQADRLLADWRYDADWFRKALQDKGTEACIPGRKSRKRGVKYDKRRSKKRHRPQIMFGRLKDCRRVATRDDTYPEALPSATASAANVLFRL